MFSSMLTTNVFELLKIKKFNGDWLPLYEITGQNLRFFEQCLIQKRHWKFVKCISHH
jgi:hypothetical protein